MGEGLKWAVIAVPVDVIIVVCVGVAESEGTMVGKTLDWGAER